MPAGAPPAELQRCSRCKDIYYCGKECQAEDWKRHAGDCKRWQVPEPGDAGHWGRRELVLLLRHEVQHRIGVARPQE